MKLLLPLAAAGALAIAPAAQAQYLPPPHLACAVEYGQLQALAKRINALQTTVDATTSSRRLRILNHRLRVLKHQRRAIVNTGC